MSNQNEKLAEALGLTITTPSMELNNKLPLPIKPIIPAPNLTNNQISTDADYARENLVELIQKGSESLNQAMELAKEAAHPRCYEIVGQLLKVQSDNVDKLLKLHADVKKLNDNEEYVPRSLSASTTHHTTNIANAVFLGTSDELVRIMRKEHKAPLTIDVDDNGIDHGLDTE